MMTRLLSLALVLLLGAMAKDIAAQIPMVERPCPEERDQLRVLTRMLADGRGQAEFALAEVQARSQRLQRDLERAQARVKALEDAAKKEPPK